VVGWFWLGMLARMDCNRIAGVRDITRRIGIRVWGHATAYTAGAFERQAGLMVDSLELKNGSGTEYLDYQVVQGQGMA
jgi:hypothetical protein